MGKATTQTKNIVGKTKKPTVDKTKKPTVDKTKKPTDDKTKKPTVNETTKAPRNKDPPLNSILKPYGRKRKASSNESEDYAGSEQDSKENNNGLPKASKQFLGEQFEPLQPPSNSKSITHCVKKHFKQAEINYRKQLSSFSHQLDMSLRNIDATFGVLDCMLEPDFMNTKLYDILKAFKYEPAVSFMDLMNFLQEEEKSPPVLTNVPFDYFNSEITSPLSSCSTNVTASSDSENVKDLDLAGLRSLGKPITSEMRCFASAGNMEDGDVFVFKGNGEPSTSSNTLIPPSTNKKPRAIAPGEVVYSVRGSPILTRKVPSKDDTQRLRERFQVLDEKGEKMDVEVSTVKTIEPSRKKLFKKIVTDVRAIALTRSVSVQRVAAQRVPVPASAQSSTNGPPNKRSRPMWQI